MKEYSFILTFCGGAQTRNIISHLHKVYHIYNINMLSEVSVTCCLSFYQINDFLIMLVVSRQKDIYPGYSFNLCHFIYNLHKFRNARTVSLK